VEFDGPRVDSGVPSTSMRRVPAGSDFDGWVHELGGPSRRQLARRHLMGAGAPAVPALRRGLISDDAMVRRLCAVILDHLLDAAAVPDLVAALDDPDPDVCARALHALACDQCKQNECRPDDALFVPKAIELVGSHPDPRVRAAAIDALGKVLERPAGVSTAVATTALVEAARRDPVAGMRNMAERRLRLARRPTF